MEYTYPVFRIRQIHLWPPERTYYPGYYYDPWFSPYPYYYADPWWRFSLYYDYSYPYIGDIPIATVITGTRITGTRTLGILRLRPSCLLRRSRPSVFRENGSRAPGELHRTIDSSDPDITKERSP